MAGCILDASDNLVAVVCSPHPSAALDELAQNSGLLPLHPPMEPFLDTVTISDIIING